MNNWLTAAQNVVAIIIPTLALIVAVYPIDKRTKKINFYFFHLHRSFLIYLALFGVCAAVAIFLNLKQNALAEQTDRDNRITITNLVERVEFFTDQNSQLLAEVSYLTNQNVQLRAEMKQQFHDLTIAFSTNSGFAEDYRLAELNELLRSNERDTDEVSHEILELPKVGLQAMREEWSKQQKLYQLQAQHDDLEQQMNSIKDERERKQRQLADSKEITSIKKLLDGQTLPAFDYVISLFNYLLGEAASDTGKHLMTDFEGTPTIYASHLERDNLIMNGTNYLWVGTNSTWSFAIYTHVDSVTLPALKYGRKYSLTTLTIQATNIFGTSSLTICPQFLYKYQWRTTPQLFEQNKISSDTWLNRFHVTLSLPNPNSPSTDTFVSSDDFTNEVYKYLRNLVEAQDPQFPLITNRQIN